MARILVMSDNPNINTGMGRVHKEIAGGLHNRGHDVRSIGWFSSVDAPNKMPWPVKSTQNQYYGADVFDQVVAQFRPDIVITIGDCWMISHIADPGRCRNRKWFQWIGYIPIDGAAHGNVLPPTWVDVFKDMDYKVAYTEYGKRIITNTIPEMADEIHVIPHGVDTSTFHPLPVEEMTKMRRQVGLDVMTPEGVLQRKICFLCVARNQFRKNIPEVAKAWAQFTKDGAHPKAVFWPHTVFQDPMGWNLDEIFDIAGIRKTLMFFEKAAHSPSHLKLLPEQDLNKLYNICDVFTLIAGEGWGLPTLEAMACAKPVVVLDHSANTEIAEGRGELVDVGAYCTGSHSTERPLPDTDSLVKAWDLMYQYTERRETYGKAGYKFVTEGDPDQFHGKGLTWDNALDQWEELVTHVLKPLDGPVSLMEVS